MSTVLRKHSGDYIKFIMLTVNTSGISTLPLKGEKQYVITLKLSRKALQSSTAVFGVE